MIAQQFFNQLVESLELVAADYDVQRRVLPAFVVVPDEIALTFENAMDLIDQIVDAGLLTNEQVALLKKLDALFEKQSDGCHESFWTMDAIQNDPTWAAIRTLARKILLSLNQPVREPELSWIRYEPAHG